MTNAAAEHTDHGIYDYGFINKAALVIYYASQSAERV